MWLVHVHVIKQNKHEIVLCRLLSHWHTTAHGKFTNWALQRFFHWQHYEAQKKNDSQKNFPWNFFLLLFSPLNNKSIFHWWSLFLLNPQIFFPEVNKNSSLNLLNTHISITLFHIIFLHHSNSHFFIDFQNTWCAPLAYWTV